MDMFHPQCPPTGSTSFRLSVVVVGIVAVHGGRDNDEIRLRLGSEISLLSSVKFLFTK